MSPFHRAVVVQALCARSRVPRCRSVKEYESWCVVCLVLAARREHDACQARIMGRPKCTSGHLVLRIHGRSLLCSMGVLNVSLDGVMVLRGEPRAGHVGCAMARSIEVQCTLAEKETKLRDERELMRVSDRYYTCSPRGVVMLLQQCF